MSVLIKGMDMPKCCADCGLTYLDTGDDAYFGGNEYRCVIDGSPISILSSERPYDCPLVEVKIPHGRLIDADILYDKFAELDAQALEHTCNLGNKELNEEWRKWSAILAERTAFKHDVYDAPTVIETEE